MKTTVAFFIFNRPDVTSKVFEVIRQVQPPKLFVIADGHRHNYPGEAEKCEATRAIINNVDWDCQVLTNYSDVNLGCKLRIVSGLNWVFDNVEEAIILEDDCLPHPSFFHFCEEMLIEYRNEARVMQISGTNLIPIKELDSSFVFSRLVPCWGWATWKRAWIHYDMEMTRWPEYKQSQDIEYFGNQKEVFYRVFEDHYTNKVNAWATRWAFACVVNNGLSIIPKTNLIQNIGFGEEATHTKRANKLTSVAIEGLEFPIVKPLNMSANSQFDEKYIRFIYGSPVKARFVSYLKALVQKIKILKIKTK